MFRAWLKCVRAQDYLSTSYDCLSTYEIPDRSTKSDPLLRILASLKNTTRNSRLHEICCMRDEGSLMPKPLTPDPTQHAWSRQDHPTTVQITPNTKQEPGDPSLRPPGFSLENPKLQANYSMCGCPEVGALHLYLKLLAYRD